ncbi:MAG: Golgi to ER traffic- protein, partial [Chaenotheca gracillima]
MATSSQARQEDISPNGSKNAQGGHASLAGSKSKGKSKESKEKDCDGNTPSCAACSSVYGTECVYDPTSDHRRKGVYKKDIDSLKTRNSTLQTLIQAILNYPEDEVAGLVRQIRTCESLDEIAEGILARENGQEEPEDEADSFFRDDFSPEAPRFETELSGKMGELRLDDGLVRHIGGTSNLIFLGSDPFGGIESSGDDSEFEQQEEPLTSWTTVTPDARLIVHLMNMYFTWHYTYFTTLSKDLFYRDFVLGKPPAGTRRKTVYCTSLLVNAMLALGCHFTSVAGSRADPQNSATAGDHFFKEAKRLILENDEHEKPQLPTVQALALMSVREAGCGREAKGWIYSGMSFRMACDLGLNLNLTYSQDSNLNEQEIDARKITFWGCFLFDKCWSNYLGRQPQLAVDNSTVPKIDVFPSEDAATWSPYTDSGTSQVHAQPARTRAVALQISQLCEISSDLLIFFYHPTQLDRHSGKSSELKKLSDLHTRLEAWKKNLPREMEARDGALPSVLLMHMFSQLLFIHLYRPFLKYNQATSPLPAHVSPRKLCTQAASMVSKLLRLYKRTYGLRQICNIAVYIAHSACTIHLLNLPDKNAKRDIVHGLKHLEEIAESWLCARRTLGILSVLTKRWSIDLPEEASVILNRTDSKFGMYASDDSTSPRSTASTGQSSRSQPNRDNGAEVTGDASIQSEPVLRQPAETNMSPQHVPFVAKSPSEFPTSYPQTLSAVGVQSVPQPALHAVSDIQNHPQNHASPSMLSDGSDGAVQSTGQHWWVNDQASLATGFSNWNTDPSMVNAPVNDASNIFAFD